MSGICGLFNLDDRPVSEPELAAMTAMLKKRGPDATRLWHNGPIGMGHTLLATTPELLFERQPYEHTETGYVITADVRLDNREELIAALTPGREPGSIGDAELILTAYLNWGEACLDRLLGDFAFALWDPRIKKLFCARDHSGMRQLYYHYTQAKRFVFATDARAILVLPQVPYRINEGRVADFLVGELEWIDYTSTFFEEVFRLPPGHKATISPAGLSVSEYWRPAPVPDFESWTDREYKEGFLEVFTQAVDARLRVPAGAVGSMLSGGHGDWGHCTHTLARRRQIHHTLNWKRYGRLLRQQPWNQ
jgi:asparagine synthase (glutamine-hydrolysing)